jgi:exodeoxyribonuclease-5
LATNPIHNLLINNLGYPPTEDQYNVLEKLSSIIQTNSNDTILVVTGYAGTGKTSIISSLVKSLDVLRMKSVLLAPTGRAAKVLSSYSGRKALTIHKKIYRQKTYKDGEGQFVLDRNMSSNTWFIVDEASMISNVPADNSIFGSGRLLEDLVEYIYTGKECKLILVGDTAQLPPVGSDVSPALDMTTLSQFGFYVENAELRQVVRQSRDSGILMNATGVRIQIAGKELTTPKIDFEGYTDIIRLQGTELIDEISSAYSICGTDGTAVVVSSNKLANRYNQGIRNSIFFREEEISTGDIVMVVKNNYFLIDEEEENGPGFIANGDIAEIRRIRRYEERYGMRFATMELFFPDYDLLVDSKVMLDVLHLDSPALPSEKAKDFFFSVEADYMGIKTKKKRYEAIKNNPYYNALQVKFAYAVTCHKSQGGQWKRVFIDQGFFSKREISLDYLRWFYTALTRATEKIYLVNFPDDWFVGDVNHQ